MKKVQLSLSFNYGFKWYKHATVYAKGYVYLNQTIVRDEALAQLFEEMPSFVVFCEKVQALNGHFSIVVETDDDIWIAVDRLRTFPLFYNDDDGSVTDNLAGCDTKEIDADAESEFKMLGYVLGSQTMLTKWKQLQAGCCRSIQKRITEEYYTYCVSQTKKIVFADALAELESIFDKAFNQMVCGLNGRQVALPLSGGYDSRLIAAYLKKASYHNVVCYTYGNPANAEIQTSKNVAQALGFPWFFIDYTDIDFNLCIEEKQFAQYCNFSSNYVSMFFLQEYFAVKELKRKKIIDDDAIFIPGVSGDFIAGSHITESVCSTSSADKLADHIYRKNYVFAPAHSKKHKQRLGILLEGKEHYSYSSLYENWDLKERQAKFIVNYVREHEFFGYEHRMPFWDIDFMDFFKNLPVEFKLHKKLYDQLLEKKIFKELGIEFSKKHQPTLFEIRKQVFKDNLKKLLPSAVVDRFKNKTDNYCTDAIARILLRDIGIEPLQHNHYRSDVYILWYLHQIRNYIC